MSPADKWDIGLKILSMIGAGALAGCAAHVGVTVEAPVYPVEQIHIPPGHMPPPGECRIWFPGRPPGQQPPPGDCYDLEHEVPADAVLVRG